MVAGRGKITWKDPVQRRNELRAHPYVSEVRLPEGLAEKYMVSLIPGSLWITTVPLVVDERYSDKRYEQHEYRYLTHDFYALDVRRRPAGALAIYAGQVRVSEEDARGHVMRIPRHTFLVDGVRYMTLNLAEYKPVSEVQIQEPTV